MTTYTNVEMHRLVLRSMRAALASKPEGQRDFSTIPVGPRSRP